MPKQINKKYNTIDPVLNGVLAAGSVMYNEVAYFGYMQEARRLLMGAVKYSLDYYATTSILRKNNWNVNRCINKLNTKQRPKTVGQLFEDQITKVEESEHLSSKFKKDFAVAMRRAAGSNVVIQKWWLEDAPTNTVHDVVGSCFDWTTTFEDSEWWGNVWDILNDAKI